MTDEKERDITTKLVHAGERQAQPEAQPVSTPIYASATFTYDSMDEIDQVFSGEKQGFIYTRYGNPTTAALEEAGVFQKPRRVEANYAAVTRKYVELGYGIGLVLGLPDRPSTAGGLHERSIAKLVAPETIYLVRRKTELPNEPLRAFMTTIAGVLDGKKAIAADA